VDPFIHQRLQIRQTDGLSEFAIDAIPVVESARPGQIVVEFGSHPVPVKQQYVAPFAAKNVAFLYFRSPMATHRHPVNCVTQGTSIVSKMRNTEDQIQRAIEIGEKNQRVIELVRNWCGNVSIKLGGGTGLVEAQTGLPIGPRLDSETCLGM
jgi:hypothetical protein